MCSTFLARERATVMRFLRGVSASQPQLEDQTNRDAWPVGRGGAAKGCGTLWDYFDVHER
jgi:hypothetical protein